MLTANVSRWIYLKRPQATEKGDEAMNEQERLLQESVSLLHPLLAAYVCREMKRTYKDRWWEEVQLNLSDPYGALPEDGPEEQLIGSLDFLHCLQLLDRQWRAIFSKLLSLDFRNWSKEAMGLRNRLAHANTNPIKKEQTWRDLDTLARIASVIDEDVEAKIRGKLRRQMYGSEEGSRQGSSAKLVERPEDEPSEILRPVEKLKPWRQVIRPHTDVAEGRFRKAEFAADLSMVARQEGSLEYRDPVEFFNQTYLTEGLENLLFVASKRILEQGGDAIIQIKTAFGGGKTHSILALYHLMRGGKGVSEHPQLKGLMEKLGTKEFPKVHVATLVGTSLDPSKASRPPDFSGHQISTLWGEMAYQLLRSAGREDRFDLVKEADKKGVSPGSKAMAELFDLCGPCMVLIDELVAYAKKLYGVERLVAGSFDNLMTFIQELSEAARASRCSLVVASIPESEIEIGGEGGQKALQTIQHTFGRMEAIWKPVSASEGFEVVRRRLFSTCDDEEARAHTARAYMKLYQEDETNFPREVSKQAYMERIKACYPIHPEIFDRLYEDWASMDGFQRTRGVLRLMASVIHELWMQQDDSPLIMPGSLPLNIPNVRDELTRYLDDAWNSIVDSEVDGKQSKPHEIDSKHPRFGLNGAARRLSRSIFLGSAPSSSAQKVRGVLPERLYLATMKPKEDRYIFQDALGELEKQSAYLYRDSGSQRFWYGTRPTLKKIFRDVKHGLDQRLVQEGMLKAFNGLRAGQSFARVHSIPSSSQDVPDEQGLGLVVLRPDDPYHPKLSREDPGRSDGLRYQENQALAFAEAILMERGSAQRLYKNQLAFLAADSEKLKGFEGAVKDFLAWQEIAEGIESLDLTESQVKEVHHEMERSHKSLFFARNAAYQWILVPRIDLQEDMKTIQWEAAQLQEGNSDLIERAAQTMVEKEWKIDRWSPMLLKMELDRLLWKDKAHLAVKELWDLLGTHCYLPRLSGVHVLHRAIKDGLETGDFFLLALGYEDGRYLGLRHQEAIEGILPSDLLVKRERGLEQLAKEAEAVPVRSSETSDVAGSAKADLSSSLTADEEHRRETSQALLPYRRFYLSKNLRFERIHNEVLMLVQEVLTALEHHEGTTLAISLEVQAQFSKGVSPELKRTIMENSKTLEVEQYGFEE